MTSDPLDPYYGQPPDFSYIEHALPPTELDEDGKLTRPLVEGTDFVWDDVCQADGTVQQMMIRRPRP